MNKSETKAGQDRPTQSFVPNPATSFSSQGNSSVSITPKDVSPDEASARDQVERKINSDDPDVRQEALLDEANDLSFPASDPISVPSTTRIEAKPKAAHVLDEHGARIVVPNTQPDTPRVTLFGQLDDGSYVAKVMDEDAVPYTRYWNNAIDQAIVYIEPDGEQLERIVNALNDGRLEFYHLQDFGTANGGTSTIAV